MSKEYSYDSIAKFLHWGIGLAILFMIALGWYMGEVPKSDPMRFSYYQLHKSVGITILLLSFLRLGWRFAHSPPPLPESMRVWEKFLAKFVVAAFYALMIGIPLLGWALVSSSPRNIPTILFGLIPWPHLPVLSELEHKKEISEQLGEIHGFLAYSVLALLVLHVSGALKHHFIQRDDTLLNMTPRSLSRVLNRLRGTKNV